MPAFLLTIAYSVLSHLSPASLMPREVGQHIMLWIGAVCALACLPSVLSYPGFWRSAQTYLMMGLIAIVAISRFAHPELGRVLPLLVEFVSSGIVFFMVIAAVNTIRKLRVLAFAIVLSALYLLSHSLWDLHVRGPESRYGLQQRVAGSNELIVAEYNRLRSVGFLEDPNAFAQYLLVAASLLGLAWTAGRWRRNLIVVMLPVAYLLYGIYATHSRGALVRVAIVVFMALQIRMSRKTSVALVLALLAVFALTGAAGPRPTTWNEADVVGRIQAWEAGLTMFRSAPLFGVGFREFEQYNNNFTAHNSFVLCLAELGLCGYLFWLGLIVFSLVDLNGMVRSAAARQGAPELVGSAIVVRTALMAFLATAWFLSRTYVVTLYLLLGMAVVIRQLLAQQPDVQPLSPRPRWAFTLAVAAGSLVLLRATIWLKGS